MKSQEELAKIAYTGYGKTTDFKNYQGLPMPSWESLPPNIKEAWCAAVECLGSEFLVWALSDEGFLELARAKS